MEKKKLTVVVHVVVLTSGDSVREQCTRALKKHSLTFFLAAFVQKSDSKDDTVLGEAGGKGEGVREKERQRGGVLEKQRSGPKTYRQE